MKSAAISSCATAFCDFIRRFERRIPRTIWFTRSGSRRRVPRKPWLCCRIGTLPPTATTRCAAGLARLGISALRISLPYHDYRMPAELQRADYAVSSNICRTMDAARQAVIDVRCCFDWLQSQGYERLGIVGTSLGSAYACLASAHDDRVSVNVFNHCSTYVADVVWTGLSTQHIRQSLEEHIDLDRLRQAWMAVSPVSYMEKFAAKKQKSLFIYAAYDTTFPPELSRDIVAQDAGILGGSQSGGAAVRPLHAGRDAVQVHRRLSHLFVLEAESVGLERLVLGVAERIQFALGAPGLARQAQRAAVIDQLQREFEPFLFRDDLHQVLLDLHRVGVLGQIQPLRVALNVRVHHDPLHGR